jgi:hypothetical protein
VRFTPWLPLLTAATNAIRMLGLAVGNHLYFSHISYNCGEARSS